MHESLTCWFLMRFPAIYSAISRPENDGSAKKLSRKSCENGSETRRPRTPKQVRWCPVVRVLSFLCPEDKRAAGWQVFMQNVQRRAQKLKPSPFISIVKHSANGSIGSSVLAHKIKPALYHVVSLGHLGTRSKKFKAGHTIGKVSRVQLASVLLWLAARVMDVDVATVAVAE